MLHPIATLHAAVSNLPDSPARTLWLDTLADLPTVPSGTLKAWARAHHGATVHTYQWRIDTDGSPRSPWCPGPRTLDSRTRASALMLDESIRDYAGCRVIGASDDAIVCATPFGDSVQYFAYIVAD